MAPQPTQNALHDSKAAQNGQAPNGEHEAAKPGFKMTAPPNYDTPEEEREHRKERLAASYRIFGRLGFDEGVAGHISYRDPIVPSAFWVTPFGKNFNLMQASDLLLISSTGDILMGGKPELQLYNRAAFAIHHAIHSAREDIHAACHSHSLYGKAFATLGKEIEITTQDSCVFYKKCGLYNSFGGVVVDDDEGARIAGALGTDKNSLILQNHGILTGGSTVEAAVHRFVALERHCQVMLLADAASAGNGKKPITIDDEDAEFTHQQVGSEPACWFQAAPLYQMVDYLDSEKFSYKD